MPVTLIAIDGNGALAGVGLDENEGKLLLYGSGGCTFEIEVIEEPREGSVIKTCAELE